MPLPLDTIEILHAQVTALLDGLGWERLHFDYRDDAKPSAAGVTGYQLRTMPRTVVAHESNANARVADIGVTVVRVLDDPADERAYTTGPMLRAAAQLSDPDFWRPLAIVDRVEQVEASDATRSGNVVVFTVDVRVTTTKGA